MEFVEMTPEQMRELAAKKAEEWIIPFERVAGTQGYRRSVGTAQNYTAREIADAIRALPLEGAGIAQRPSDYDAVVAERNRAQQACQQIAERLNAAAAQRPDQEPVAWRTKNEFGYWYITQAKAEADTWIEIEKIYAEPLYAAPAQSPDHRMEDDMTLSWNVRKSTMEECARFFDDEGSSTVAEKIRSLAAAPVTSTEREPLAKTVQCPKCLWWTNSPTAHKAECQFADTPVTSTPRTCATCHAILADGPQPAATYTPVTQADLPRTADSILADVRIIVFTEELTADEIIDSLKILLGEVTETDFPDPIPFPSVEDAKVYVEDSFSSPYSTEPDIRPEAQFLLDRLQEYDPGDFDSEREFHGHVAPAIARLRSALALQERAAND
jgi:hypothetical protein